MVKGETMGEEMGKLRQLVRVGVAQAPAFLGGLTVDEALERRRSPEFDEQWMRAYQRVEATGADMTAFADVEASVFESLYCIFEGSDFAGCVAEDVGLLHSALAAGIEDAWLSALLSAYARGRFPTGKLVETKDRFAEVLARV